MVTMVLEIEEQETLCDHSELVNTNKMFSEKCPPPYRSLSGPFIESLYNVFSLIPRPPLFFCSSVCVQYKQYMEAEERLFHCRCITLNATEGGTYDSMN